MKRIHIQSLVGSKKLDFNLYDENGQILCKKGEIITPGLLMILNLKKVYTKPVKTPERKPNKSEDYEYNSVRQKLENIIDDHKLILSDNEPINTGEKSKSVISPKTSQELLNNTREVLQSVSEGMTPPVSSYIGTGEQIINEVASNLKKGCNINELRVYDKYTSAHCINVSTISTAIGIALNLNLGQLKNLAIGAFLHDIGKMLIPKEILYKPAKLTSDEYQEAQKHSVLGFKFACNKLKIHPDSALVILEHQERANGQGYPRALNDNNMSLFSRIVAVADVYDALISNKIYKNAISSPDAMKILLLDSHNSFSRKILEKFVYLTILQSNKST